MSLRTVPCVCKEWTRDECVRCGGKGTFELGENEFEWPGEHSFQGKITVGVDGSLAIVPDDPHYRGTLSRDEAYALALRILELQGGLDIRKLFKETP